MLGELRAYRDHYGDCLVPSTDPALAGLAHWVSQQRRLKALGRLPDEQRRLLDDMGFEWHHDEGCWWRMFRQLEQFTAAQGHQLPPPQGATRRLAHWVYAQRALRRTGKLSQQRVACLDQIGFQWSALQARWWLMCRALVRHREKSGSAAFGWEDNSVLARWCRVQRRERRRNRLEADRIAALDEVGFVWAARSGADKWNQRMEEITAYHQSHNHCNVPVNYPPNPQLGLWVYHQRQFLKKGLLAPERIAQLDALGFCWSVREATWEKNFALFKRYAQTHGHAWIGAEHRRLAAWAYDQRVAHQKGVLCRKRVARLNALGFNWTLRGK